MSTAQIYLPPLLGMVALAFVTALAILFSRLVDLIRNKRPLSFYEEFDGLGAPLSVLRPTRQLANQFEFPVLFYALMVIAIAIPVRDPPIAELAWFYVALRWAHALSHLLFNRLYIRTPLFMIGNVTLLAMWLVLAFTVLD